jgi:hypothetical protein
MRQLQAWSVLVDDEERHRANEGKGTKVTHENTE